MGVLTNIYSYFNLDAQGDKELIDDVTSKINQATVNFPSTDTGIPFDIETYNLFTEMFALPETRIALYKAYEYLDDNYSEIASALDLLADESIVIDLDKQSPFWVNCDNPQIKTLLESLYFDTLKYADGTALNQIVRNLNKYGDNFNEIVIDKVRGVVKVKELPCKSMHIKFDLQGSVLGYHQQFLNAAVAGYMLDFEPWQIAHMMVPSRIVGGIYGRSAIQDAVKPSKMLEAVEVAAMMSRLNGAVDRYVYEVPVGKRNATDAKSYLNEIKGSLRRKRLVNTRDGEFKSVTDVLTAMEDLFVPTREAEAIKISKLDKRGAVTDRVQDIEYFSTKQKNALRLPFSYLVGSDQLDSSKSLSNTDIRFARRIQKLQNIVRRHLVNIGETHMSYVWYNKKEPFTLQMTSVSKLEEQASLEMMELRLNLAGTFMQYLPDEYLYEHVLKFNAEESKEYIKTARIQKNRAIMDDAVAQANANIAAQKLEMSSGLGGDSGMSDDANPDMSMASESKVVREFNNLLKKNPKLMENISSLRGIVEDLNKMKADDKKSNGSRKQFTVPQSITSVGTDADGEEFYVNSI